jgi:hypothetical protein
VVPMKTAFNDMYAPDWDVEEMIEKGDIEAGHPTLEQVDATEAVRRVAAFLQAWLYFGLLEAVIAAPISTTFLTRADTDGIVYLYSRMIPVLLTAWTKRLGAMAEDAANGSLSAAIICSHRASSILAELLKRLSSDADHQPFGELKFLLVSVEPALSALHEAIATFGKANLASALSDGRSFTLSDSPLPKLYSENLIRKGWCRFIIANAEKALSAAFMRFVDMAGFVGTTSGHEECDAENCRRNNIDTTTYVPQHWPAGCRCEFVKPDLAVILEILDENMIPVVRLDEDSQLLVIGGVDPNEKQADYIAFSHVWADGLGSTAEAGLPSC